MSFHRQPRDAHFFCLKEGQLPPPSGSVQEGCSPEAPLPASPLVPIPIPPQAGLVPSGCATTWPASAVSCSLAVVQQPPRGPTSLPRPQGLSPTQRQPGCPCSSTSPSRGYLAWTAAEPGEFADTQRTHKAVQCCFEPSVAAGTRAEAWC